MRTATGQRLLVFVPLLLLLLPPPPRVLGFVASLDSDFTFTLPAGRKECFFQTMKKEATLEIEFQVRREGGGKIGDRLYMKQKEGVRGQLGVFYIGASVPSLKFSARVFPRIGRYIQEAKRANF